MNSELISRNVVCTARLSQFKLRFPNLSECQSAMLVVDTSLVVRIS